MSESERRLQLSDSFKFSICEVSILYALLNEFPRGGKGRKIGYAASFTPYGLVYRHLTTMVRRGLVKRSGKKGEYVYEAAPFENPEVRKIFEEHDDPMKIYFALDKRWLEIKGY